MRKRDEAVEVMRSWIGATKGSSKHLAILSYYNKHLPHPRGHIAVVTDDWCAITVCACMVKIGCDDISPFECSCTKLIEQAKEKMFWIEEDDARNIEPGDLILFDWEDSGKGDCTGQPNHIGMIENYDLLNNEIILIDGNYSGKCGRRKIKYNDKYIRGFIKIPYEIKDKNIKEYTDVYTYVVQAGDNLTKVAKKFNVKKEDIIKWNKDKYPKISYPPYWLQKDWILTIKKEV